MRKFIVASFAVSSLCLRRSAPLDAQTPAVQSAPAPAAH
jgi:hypothetical protein